MTTEYYCSPFLCDTEITIGSSFEVAGDGYVEFERALLPHRRRQISESVVFTVTTTEPNGLVFWQGQRPGEQSGGDYLAVELRDGLVEFRSVVWLIDWLT